MMGVGQALSVPTVDLSKYQTPLIGAVGTSLAFYHGFIGDLGDTHLAWPVVCVERDFSGTHLQYSFQITHFLSLIFNI